MKGRGNEGSFAVTVHDCSFSIHPVNRSIDTTGKRIFEFEISFALIGSVLCDFRVGTGGDCRYEKQKLCTIN